MCDELIPWARAGGDDLAHRFASRVAIDLDPERLEALVFAYWLERLAVELLTHRSYGDQAWLAGNLDPVLAAIGSD